MTDDQIVEYALRTAELASGIGAARITHEMLALVAFKLRRHAPALATIDPEIVVTTDYRGSPCS